MNRRVTESSYKKDECKRKREEEGEIDSHSKAGITELTWQQAAGGLEPRWWQLWQRWRQAVALWKSQGLERSGGSAAFQR